MILKKVIFFLLLVTTAIRVTAQDDFCDAANTIIKDAPNKFRNIKGNTLNESAGGNIWTCGIKVPGTINSRFVASMGLFYEGALFQTKNKEEIKAVYEKYKTELKDCFIAQGYTLSQQDNFFPGMQDYKKLVFMPKDDGGMPPSHVTMEAMYNKQVGLYTVVMYIFEH